VQCPNASAIARKRSGRRVASSAAIPAPAERPASAIRSGSTGCSRQTWSIAASMVPASPCARPERVSYQFQQPAAFGKPTLLRVEHQKTLTLGNPVHLAARSQGFGVLPAEPCSITTSGSRSVRRSAGGLYSQ
jgi:hypothetical protein